MFWNSWKFLIMYVENCLSKVLFHWEISEQLSMMPRHRLSFHQLWIRSVDIEFKLTELKALYWPMFSLYWSKLKYYWLMLRLTVNSNSKTLSINKKAWPKPIPSWSMFLLDWKTNSDHQIFMVNLLMMHNWTSINANFSNLRLEYPV